jgi:hypothetical protein
MDAPRMNEEMISDIYEQAKRGELPPEEAYDQIISLGGDAEEAAAILLWEPDSIVEIEE